MAEIAAWLGSLTNLRHVELSRFFLDSFSQLRNIVCACRGLESLRICEVARVATDHEQVMGLLQYPSPLEPQTLFYAQPEWVP